MVPTVNRILLTLPGVFMALGTPLALAQTAPPSEVVPTPAAEASGWGDIGFWSIVGLAVVVVILLVMVWRRRR